MSAEGALAAGEGRESPIFGFVGAGRVSPTRGLDAWLGDPFGVLATELRGSVGLGPAGTSSDMELVLPRRGHEVHPASSASGAAPMTTGSQRQPSRSIH